MKFKDKDGVVYEDICKAVFAYCHDRNCRNCALTEFKKDYIMSNCPSKALLDPAEAARLMGYEVIEEDEKPIRTSHMTLNEAIQHLEDIIPRKDWSCKDCKQEHEQLLEWLIELEERCKQDQKDVNMAKPLKDWTLGETQRECALHRRGGSYICEGCAFDFNECPFSKDWPEEWELEKPRFTPKEIEAAQWIQRMFPERWLKLKRYEDNDIRMVSQDGSTVPLVESAFPSIRPGQTVKLSDILGAPNTDHGKEVKP